MLFSVPRAKASGGLPAIVAVPGFDGCLNHLWLPRVRARRQPSSAMIRHRFATFTVSSLFGGRFAVERQTSRDRREMQ
jgi:hypothetical protein